MPLCSTKRRLAVPIAMLLLILLPSLPIPAASQTAARPEPASTKELTVGTKEAPPFAMKAPNGDWEGISIELWRNISDQLGLKYRFHETTLDGLIDGTADGSLDVGIAALTITPEREKSVDFSQPYYETGLGIAVSTKDESGLGALVRSIFSVGLLKGVLGLLGVLMAVGLVVWLIERERNHHFGGGKQGLLSGLLWSATTAAGGHHERGPATVPGQLVAIAWMFASVLVISTFTAVITSAMTTSRLHGAIQGLRDLHSVRVGTVPGSEAMTFLTQERIASRGYQDVETGLKALEGGAIDAFVYDRPLLTWQIKRSFPDTLRVLDATFDKQTYGIALPNGSPLRMPINRVLLSDLRSEWWQRLTFRYFGED